MNQHPHQLAAAGVVAFLGAKTRSSIPLAQLDFAGAFNAFKHRPRRRRPGALLVMAAVGGC